MCYASDRTSSHSAGTGTGRDGGGRAGAGPYREREMTDPTMHTPEERSREPSSAPSPTRGPYLTAVRDAWRTAWREHDPRHPRLDLALRSFARDGCARGVSVGALLRALDDLVHPGGGESGMDLPTMREWAGTTVIRAYFSAD